VGRVAYIRSLHHHRLHQLLSMGISPGVKICLYQRTPVLVVAIDQSEFAMDAEVARDVYVWLDPSIQSRAARMETTDSRLSDFVGP
jgi:DtxR family Mn-dependent transcriptional regulator